MARAIVVIAALWLAAVAFAMRSTAHFDPEPIHEGFRSPVVALELARTGAAVAKILREPIGEGNRAIMAAQIGADWWFIPAYWLLFAGLAALQCGGGRPLARRLGPAVLCAITMAAAFDVAENRAILRALGSAGAGLTDAAALAIRRPSLVKWGSIFAACVLVSPFFLDRKGDRVAPRLVAALTGLLLLAAGIVGAVGLASNPWIEVATGVMALGLVLATLFVMSFPGSFSADERRDRP